MAFFLLSAILLISPLTAKADQDPNDIRSTRYWEFSTEYKKLFAPSLSDIREIHGADRIYREVTTGGFGGGGATAVAGNTREKTAVLVVTRGQYEERGDCMITRTRKLPWERFLVFAEAADKINPLALPDLLPKFQKFDGGVDDSSSILYEKIEGQSYARRIRLQLIEGSAEKPFFDIASLFADLRIEIQKGDRVNTEIDPTQK